jgi:hypothetical protein
VGTGNKTAAQAGLDFGKSALSAAVNVGMGELGKGIMGSAGKEVIDAAGNVTIEGASGLLGRQGFGGVLARAAWTGAQTWTTGAATSAINAFHLDKDGALAWDSYAFAQGTLGVGAMASVAQSVAGSLTGGLLGLANSGKGQLIGFNEVQKQALAGFNSFAGSLVSAGVGYAMTGNASFNVLNSNDLGIGGGTGMFELSFGTDGLSGRLGMGGTDVSMGTVGTAMLGAWVWDRNSRIGSYCDANGLNANIALRAQYGYGNDAAMAQMDDILAGRAILRAGDFGDATTTAQTTLADGKRVVSIAGLGAGMSVDEQLKLAITLQHEAHRDGITGTEEEQRLETGSAVWAHSEMAAALMRDGTLGSRMAGLISSDTLLKNDVVAWFNTKMKMRAASTEEERKAQFDKYLADYVDGAYDSSADFWKLVIGADGATSWDWDGSYDFDLSALDKEKFKYKIGWAGLAAYDNDFSNGGLQILNSQIAEAVAGYKGASISLDGLLKQMAFINTFNQKANELEGSIANDESVDGASPDAEGIKESFALFAKELIALSGKSYINKKDYGEDLSANLYTLANGGYSPFENNGRWKITSRFGYRWRAGEIEAHGGTDYVVEGGRPWNIAQMFDGTLEYGYDTILGLFGCTTRTGKLPSWAEPDDITRFRFGHLGSDTVKTMIGLSLSPNVKLDYDEKNTKLYLGTAAGAAGPAVAAGMKIGVAGNSGDSWGMHTHTTFFRSDWSRVDSEWYFETIGIRFDESNPNHATSFLGGVAYHTPKAIDNHFLFDRSERYDGLQANREELLKRVASLHPELVAFIFGRIQAGIGEGPNKDWKTIDAFYKYAETHDMVKRDERGTDPYAAVNRVLNAKTEGGFLAILREAKSRRDKYFMDILNLGTPFATVKNNGAMKSKWSAFTSTSLYTWCVLYQQRLLEAQKRKEQIQAQYDAWLQHQIATYSVPAM